MGGASDGAGAGAGVKGASAGVKGAGAKMSSQKRAPKKVSGALKKNLLCALKNFLVKIFCALVPFVLHGIESTTRVRYRIRQIMNYQNAPRVYSRSNV